jgi:lipoate-protein ligase B
LTAKELTLGTRLTVLRPGSLAYGDACDLQQRTARNVRDGADNTLIILEHPPTYTMGRRAAPANILPNSERLSSMGAEVFSTDRGGDVTFHGPGQIVAYPILDLRRLGLGAADYVHGLEEVILETLTRFGIRGERSPRNRGAWVGNAKIAAIGVRVSRGVTTHGFALNVTTDLSWFEHIVPCGLHGASVTSMKQQLQSPPPITTVQNAIIDSFGAHFGLSTAVSEGVLV